MCVFKYKVDIINFIVNPNILSVRTVQDHDPVWHWLFYPLLHLHTHIHTHTGSTVWAERPLCLCDTLHCYSSQMKTRFHLNTSLWFLRLNPVCQSESWCELTCQRGQRQCGLTDTHNTCTDTHSPKQRTCHPIWSVTDMRGIITCLFELEPFDCIRYSSPEKCWPWCPIEMAGVQL